MKYVVVVRGRDDMARPKKQTVDYFPHFANSGKTIYILENKYGNDGYAFWFKLLELLATSEGHYFRAENEVEWEFLLAKTKVDDEKALNILNTLANLDAIDKKLWADKVIWVQKFVDNLSEVYRKRSVNAPKKPNKDSLRAENPTNNDITVAKTPQSKVKESKVNNINNNVCDFDEEFESLWKNYPRKIGKPKARSYYLRYRKTKDSSFKVVEEGIKNLNEYIKLNKIEDRFVPHGSTWFNQQRWNDELELNKPYSSNGKKTNITPDWYTDYQQQLRGVKVPQKEYSQTENEEVKKLVKDMFG